MSDDDDELRAMRAARAGKGGRPAPKLGFASGIGQSSILERSRRAQEASRQDEFYEDDSAVRKGAEEAGATVVADDGDDDGEDDADLTGARMEEEVYDGLRASFPQAFGEQEKSGTNLNQIHAATKKKEGLEKVAVGPPRPPAEGGDREEEQGAVAGPPRPPLGGQGSDDDEAGQSAGEEGEDADFDPYMIPTTNEVALKGHDKIVGCVAVDPTGTRVLSGSHDYTVRMYDFGGMRSDLRSFRQITPCGDFLVRSLSWSPTADQFLCVSTSAQPKIFNRDGTELGEFIRGDMYIRDMKNTKGHVTNCTGGQWHPRERNTVITSGEDGVVRVWDVNSLKQQKTVIKPLPIKPGRFHVTTCAYSPDGGLIAAAVGDGSIQVWAATGKIGTSAKIGLVAPPKQQLIDRQTWTYTGRPKDIVKKAHETNAGVSSFAFSADGVNMASRAMDGTLKLWDVRKFKSPVKEWSGLPSDAEELGCGFSPTDELLFTGTSAGRGTGPGGEGGEDGALLFFDRSRLELVRRVRMPGTVTGCLWHPRLNQIFCGVGRRGYGATHVLYDPRYSEKGALGCVARAPRKKDPFDFEAPPVVYEQHATRNKLGGSKRKMEEMKALESKKKHIPERPSTYVTGPGKHGATGATGKSMLTQYLLKEQGMLKDNRFDNDPREALLKHADEAAAKPYFFGAAYADTQPVNELAKVDPEEEEAEAQAARRKASNPLPRPGNPLGR